MKRNTCKQCGRRFRLELVDIKNHEQNCKRHGDDVLARNVKRVNARRPPERRGW